MCHKPDYVNELLTFSRTCDKYVVCLRSGCNSPKLQSIQANSKGHTCCHSGNTISLSKLFQPDQTRLKMSVEDVCCHWNTMNNKSKRKTITFSAGTIQNSKNKMFAVASNTYDKAECQTALITLISDMYCHKILPTYAFLFFLICHTVLFGRYLVCHLSAVHPVVKCTRNRF